MNFLKYVITIMQVGVPNFTSIYFHVGLYNCKIKFKVTGYRQNANQYTQKGFEYCQCVVLAGMKLVGLHRAQANVGPRKKNNASVCYQGPKNQAGELDTQKIKNLNMGLIAAAR